MFNVLDMGASGLVAQRTRMDVISANILNINTTRNSKGELSPYRRKFVTFAEGLQSDPSKPGVRIGSIKEDQSEFLKKYDPGNPDADPTTGYVLQPNIDLSIEYVNALEASRAYEANVTMMETTKAMINSSLRLIA